MDNQAKNKIRKRLRAERSQISAEQQLTASTIIQSEFIKLASKLEPQSLHTYLAITKNKEILTNNIIGFAQENNIKITHPDPQIITTNEKFDIAVLPLIAFDLEGNRLGYGGGYYDKFLANNEVGLAVGLAYEFQLVSKVPLEPHDMKLGAVITEKNVYNFS